jgi:hypothetical protein
VPSIVNVEREGTYEMTSKRSRSKAKSGAGARGGKLKVKKETLKDLDPKNSQKVRGGTAASWAATMCTCLGISCWCPTSSTCQCRPIAKF